VLGSEPELEPILLGGIFQLRGSGSWARTDAREGGMREVERRARDYGLPPLAWPPDWPANTLMAMRAATWAKRLGVVREFALAAYRSAFVDGRDLGDPDVVAAAGASAGLSPDELRAAVADQEVKDALRSATDAAWQAGVIGVPTLRVGSAVYFGDDRLEEAAAELRSAQPPP
jgi:2-hydroxychromene-2-carboxylate isomerase